VNIVGRIEPDIGCHGRREDVLARAQGLHADTLALQVGNIADAFASE
jgi:hypothetical protein